ncbi:G patch domain and ankyrin repeat-containing protein 1-like [Gigantopelta aegis]|uniref:G patch domain and ankyrin repeat-containing protein 1-like n=1 Tax=Gigantopelta aegis TaxID=1735272 RepID=UPI001B888029|nr:G patch domain and ankyrin repeat-containing protein 1-like [Gigantopelta aegis]
MTHPRLKADYQTLVQFVRASDLSRTRRPDLKPALTKQVTLDGQKVRTFYEKITSSEYEAPTDKPQRKKEHVKRVNKTSKKKLSKVTCDESRRASSEGNLSPRSMIVGEKKTHNGCEVTVQSNSSSVIGAGCEVRTGHPETVSRLGLTLLKHAQEGDTEQVKTCLLQGVSVDFQDQFGWSALMCASVGGHPDTVQFLLERKADIFRREKSGMTARDLARQKGQNCILQLFEQSQSHSEVNSVSSPSSSMVLNTDTRTTFFCTVCKQEFVDTNQRQHQTSTVHLFNMQLKPKSNNYLIPESNVGYRMLLRGGWDVDKGLGPDGSGNKFPVKTVLKRDRKGLGSEQKVPAKVTHFNPHDTNAINSIKRKCERKVSVRTLSKRAMRLKEKRDRDWEIQLRRYMNSD